MPYSPEDLLTAERHVAEAEQHVARQEEIVTRLSLDGADTGLAEELLSAFRASLAMHRRDRDLIAAELDRPA